MHRHRRNQLGRSERPVLDWLVKLARCIQFFLPVAAGVGAATVAATTVGAETGRSKLLTS